ncbi:MAG TPA: hypothetical protein VFH45_04650 [Acidimicrobiales bacterium]|nr:hypothetical protein [Acidimicrobiales bacterium]
MAVKVTPETFNLVFFDAEAIADLVSRVVSDIGLDGDVTVEVDEASALGRAQVASVEPVVLSVAGGAFEDPKRPRQLSESDVLDVCGRLLHRVHDRRDPAFGEPPPDDALTLQQSTAWDAYCVGRCARLGYPVSRPRRLYHFRNRHGFTDVADAAFERLWTGEGITWADIEAICAQTEAARQPV